MGQLAAEQGMDLLKTDVRRYDLKEGKNDSLLRRVSGIRNTPYSGRNVNVVWLPPSWYPSGSPEDSPSWLHIAAPWANQ